MSKRALEVLLAESEKLDRIQRDISCINILDIFGITSYEKAHSSFWGWLLDPGETHRVGERFLKKLLKLIAGKSENRKDVSAWPIPDLLDIETASLEKTCVTTEASPTWLGTLDHPKIALRRFDVQIEVPLLGENRKLLVVLEFKIDANEGENQTIDYSKAVAEAVAGKYYTHALTAFISPKTIAPEDETFIPVSLADMVKQVLDETAAECKDIIPTPVSELLRQYSRAVLQGVLGIIDDDESVKGFMERHKESFRELRNYLDWTAGLPDLVEQKKIPLDAEITFLDRKGDPPKKGFLRKTEGRIYIEHGGLPYQSLSTAAKAAGKRNAYNGWAHWHYNGKSLDKLRSECRKREDENAQLCDAIVRDREQALKYLIGLLSGDETGLPNKDVSRPSDLDKMFEQGLIKEGQIFKFRRSNKMCEVKQVGSKIFLAVGDKEFSTPSGASRFLNDEKSSNGFNDLFTIDESGNRKNFGNIRDEMENSQ